ncbi:unnamed protein product [Effrenium voratum]|uniref:Alcohol dehydrogenase-like N-terminal domain-containing protein n=1 Tax=Effrenium voratum TaxID=2562239 RepID=A0AA36IIU1_9DINO|nr:unnamed protein product [Effrenium voratum]
MSTKSLALTLVHPGQLELRAVWQDERLQPGEFLVEVEYSSVQPMDGDMFHCCGAFSDLALPHVMGVEGVGVVLKSENQRLKEGARIGFLLRKFFNDEHHGCWQKRLVLDERRALVLGVPPVVGLNQVAACLSSSVAALAFLKPFAPQSQIIVTGACGAVGLAVLQLGALRGHRMLAFVRGPERAAWLAGAGLAGLPSAELAVVDTNSDWVRLAAPMCGKGELMSPESQDVCGGADGIIDAVGGEVLALAAEHLLRVRATVVSFGNAACESNERLAAAQRRLRLQVRRESVESFMATPDAAEQVQKAFELIGVYQAKAWHVASWREAQECMKEQPTWTRHQTQVKPGRIGRILLKLNGDIPQAYRNHGYKILVKGPKETIRFTFEEESAQSHNRSLADMMRLSSELFDERSGPNPARPFSQMSIIISDGRFNKSKVRPWVHAALARQQLPLLIIVDDFEADKAAGKRSVFDLRAVSYETGRCQVVPYLQDFPFPYYVVVQDLQSLPAILSDVMKQWFELATSA